MSNSKTAETGIAFRPMPGEFSRAAGIPGTGSSGISTAFTGPFGDVFAGETGLSADDLNELKIFYEFLEQHVQLNSSCDVQCMLLWNEWVREFRRRASGFPALIREKEFRSAMTEGVGAAVATDGWRGSVYLGLRFVP
jgi:hypothetical protein